MRDPLDGLCAEERGIVLGAILVGSDATPRLGRIHGESGTRCVAAYRALQSATPGDRQRVVRSLVRRALAPLPAGLERIHPSWIHALLADEPDPVASLVLDALPSELRERVGRLPSHRPAARVDARLRWAVCSRAFGALEPMTGDNAPRAAQQILAEWSPDRLEEAILRIGCLVLAATLRRANSPAAAALHYRSSPCGLLVEQALAAPAALDAIDALHAFRGPEPRQKAAVESTRPKIRSLGVHWLATALPNRLARALAQRLPRDVGWPLWKATERHDDAINVSTALDQLTRVDAWAGNGVLR